MTRRSHRSGPSTPTVDAPSGSGPESPAAGGSPEVVHGELVEEASPTDEEPSPEDFDGAALPVDLELEVPGEDVGLADDAGLIDETDAVDEEVLARSKRTALAPAGGRALSRVDPLTAYMNEVRRYPLLSREDEHELAVHYVKTGDLDSARRLVTANLRLVVKIAHEYRRVYKNLLDLIQEGNVGLVQAVKKYDPYRGVKLSSYAAWWIRAYILKYILSNWRLVKLGTTQAQRKLFFNLRKERDKLEKMGFEVTSRALADSLNVPEREVIDMERRLGQGDLSLDAPVGRDEDSRTHVELLEATGETRPDVATEGSEIRDILRAKFAEFEKTLKGREQTIFQERLMNDAPLTLQEIGDRYGISRERARQLEKRLMTRLRDYLRRELGDAVEIAMGLEE